MYVVKVGEYYVREFNYYGAEIILSNEVMTSFDKEIAEIIAYRVNGTVEKLAEA